VNAPRELVAYRRERVAEWTRAGVLVGEIAVRLGITGRSVQRYRRRAGVELPAGRRLTPAQLAHAGRLLDDGCSMNETARTIGCTAHTIARHFPGRGWTRAQTIEHIAAVRRLKELTKQLAEKGISV
jgi:DNA-binding CsgD family transcriptional regulator